MVVLAILVAALASTNSAAAESLPPAPGFRLRASNGYSLRAIALSNPHNGKSAVYVFVEHRGATVLYATPAVVTESTVKADLGAVGKIDLHFVPSGKPRTERPECGGKPITFDRGRYEGVIDFEGEHGYSKVHATSAPGEGKLFLSLVCSGVSGGSEGRGGHSPGARLAVQSMGRAEIQFTAMKNSPSRPARFAASIHEKRGKMEIGRAVEVSAPPSAFAFEIPPGVASVDPPAPFAGRAVYHRRRGGSSTWSGNLSVDFPGRPDVRLTGGSAHASLERAVLNPGYPF
jgi:hypothetical protein